MSTYFDDASLVMIPSGYKDDKLYSIKPTSGDGDFTFSRDGSGASPATRVNSAGLIEKGRTNFLTYSNDFSNADWVKLGNGTGSTAVVTSGFSDPDGGSNAWRLQCDLNGGTTSSDQSLIYQLGSATGVFAFSYYVKSNTGADQDFAFGNGLAGGNFTTATATTSWQRFDTFFNCTVNNTSFIGARGTMGTDDTLDILIYAAQLEKGLVSTDVIETTTAAASAGILGDMPRLDYSGGASCPSLLLEPARTNSLPDGEYIANWAGANTTIVTNAAISPEGVQNAHSVTFASGGYWYKSVAGSYTAGSSHTWSIYATTSDQVTRWGGFTPAGTDTFSVEDVGNGWYRQSITRVVSGSGSGTFQPLMDWVSVGVGTTFYVYGAQLEYNASYPTSYVPTYGSATARAADVCNKSSATSVIGQTEGTMFVEAKIDANSTDDYNRIFGISQGNDSNRIIIFSDNQEKIVLNVKNAAVTQAQIVSNISPFSTFKAAVGYSANDFVFYINGQQIGTDSSGTVPACNTISLGTHEDASGTRGIEGSVKQALLFDTRLTNAELAALTTI